MDEKRQVRSSSCEKGETQEGYIRWASMALHRIGVEGKKHKTTGERELVCLSGKGTQGKGSRIRKVV